MKIDVAAKRLFLGWSVLMLDEFSIDHHSELIKDERTRSYFEEVKSSYTIGNYRSAVVMLWSVVVCDLVFKLQRLADIHEDEAAKKILTDIDSEQQKNPSSPAWEWGLVEKVKAQTGLLDAVDLKGLENLQSQRHLAAHPIIKEGAELHRPNKDEVRALMRMALQSVLTKPSLVSKRILDQLLVDIAARQGSFPYDDELSKYLESKYFSGFTSGVAESVFKSLWKLVFRAEDDNCEQNRKINFRVLSLMAAKDRGSVLVWVKKAADYYSNISSKSELVKMLLGFLAENKGVYPILQEHAQLTARQAVEGNPASVILAAFLYDGPDQYLKAVEEYIPNMVGNVIDSNTWASFRTQWETEEWKSRARQVSNLYYAHSGSFDTADSRFRHAIAPELPNYTLADLRHLMEEAGDNSQCYDRGRATGEHAQVKARILELDAQFDFTPPLYARFIRNVE